MNEQIENISADGLTRVIERDDATDFLTRTGLMIRIARAAIEYRRCEKEFFIAVNDPQEAGYEFRRKVLLNAKYALYRLLDEAQRRGRA